MSGSSQELREVSEKRNAADFDELDDCTNASDDRSSLSFRSDLKAALALRAVDKMSNVSDFKRATRP